jgi:hypothetical protein
MKITRPTKQLLTGVGSLLLLAVAMSVVGYLSAPNLLQPYCNRASTCWYTMDKATPQDHRNPPKYAQFPDAPVRASMYASKLVMSL